jgi:lipopolysaccharide/colanic/teichoic acid biosynthesis glycosyltransferase
MIRFFDILISIFILLIFSPLMIVISIFILVFDGQPIIFTQYRVGRKGKKFKIYKFKTMRDKNFKDESLRLTLLGKFLRRLSLDELPQFFNVINKDMSIVGPRPLPENIEKKISRSIKIKRRKILPGITGLSQINYTGKNRKLSDKIKLDLGFVENYNLYNYLIILIKTPFVLIIRFYKNKSSIIK